MNVTAVIFHLILLIFTCNFFFVQAEFQKFETDVEQPIGV